MGLVERIDDLWFRPFERVENSDAADKIVAVDFFTGPHTITAQRPLPEERGHHPPNFDRSRRTARAQIARYFRVRPHRRIGIEVAGLKRAEPESIGSDRWDLECEHLAASPEAIETLNIQRLIGPCERITLTVGLAEPSSR